MIDIHAVIRFLSEYTGPEIKIMEVCGTHTAAIFTGGIRSFLSPPHSSRFRPWLPSLRDSLFLY